MTERDVVAFFEGLGRGDVASLEDRLHEDVVLEFPGRRFGGRIVGRRRVLVFLRQNQRLFRNGLEFTVRWVGIVGDRAVAQWTNAGTTREGAEYANRGVTVFRLDGERIVEIQDYLDTEKLAETWPHERV
jgi:ketosteroid isomerase-like protein